MPVAEVAVQQRRSAIMRQCFNREKNTLFFSRLFCLLQHHIDALYVRLWRNVV